MHMKKGGKLYVRIDYRIEGKGFTQQDLQDHLAYVKSVAGLGIFAEHVVGHLILVPERRVALPAFRCLAPNLADILSIKTTGVRGLEGHPIRFERITAREEQVTSRQAEEIRLGRLYVPGGRPQKFEVFHLVGSADLVGVILLHIFKQTE